MKKNRIVLLGAAVLGLAAFLPAFAGELTGTDYSFVEASVRPQFQTAREHNEQYRAEVREAVRTSGWVFEVKTSPAGAVLVVDGLLSPDRVRVLRTFRRMEDSSYAIELRFGFSRHLGRGNDIVRWRSVFFSIEQGGFLRAGDNLVLMTDPDHGETMIPVARTRWWYDPQWQLTGNADIRYVLQRVRRGPYEAFEVSDVRLVLR